MLHRCMEGEIVDVDGSKIVDVDRHHDPCPNGTLAPPGERGRECGTLAQRDRNAPYSSPEIEEKSSGIRHYLA